MLFDLRSRGRRRVVKVVYLGLALLLGGGLVLFGIGGDVSGGLVDAFNGGSGSSDNTFEERADDARKATQERPQDAAAWAKLAVAEYQFAQDSDGIEEVQDPETGQIGTTFTETGQARLAAADRAWERHLELADKPDPLTAATVVNLYSQGALDDPAKAARAQEIAITPENEGFGQYARLAIFSYQAGQARKGDLAAARARELAPDKETRKQLQQQFDEAKLGAASGGGAATTTTTPSG